MAKLRYNLILNPAVVDRIDVYAKDNDLSRSEAVNMILYDFCNDKGIYCCVDNTILDGQIKMSGVME